MLEPLGGEFAILTIGAKQMIRSVPKELNTDQAVVLEATQVLGYVSVSMLQVNLRWSKPRAVAIIEDLLADGLLWEDIQTGGEPEILESCLHSRSVRRQQQPAWLMVEVLVVVGLIDNAATTRLYAIRRGSQTASTTFRTPSCTLPMRS